MKPTKNFLFSSLLGVLLLLPATSWAQGTNDCQQALSDAESAYFNGEFDQTIALLQPCVGSEDYTLSQGVRAYSLLGRTQFVLGESDAAGEAIRGLYTLSPEYEPEATLPPNFTAFILSIKDDMIADGSFPSDEPEPEVIVDPEDPEPTPPVVVAEDVPTTEQDEKKQRSRRVLLFGGGAALAVAAGAILLSGGSGGGDEPPVGSDWPFPPAHPQ